MRVSVMMKLVESQRWNGRWKFLGWWRFILSVSFLWESSFCFFFSSYNQVVFTSMNFIWKYINIDIPYNQNFVIQILMLFYSYRDSSCFKSFFINHLKPVWWFISAYMLNFVWTYMRIIIFIYNLFYAYVKLSAELIFLAKL